MRGVLLASLGIASVAFLGCGDTSREAAERADSAAAAPDSVQVGEGGAKGYPPSRDPNRPAGTIGPPEQAAQVAARVSEWQIELSPAQVPTGEVTVNIENRGERPHTIELRSETQGRWRTVPIPPGGKIGLSMPLLAGTYEVVSTDSAYMARGMRATLTVR